MLEKTKYDCGEIVRGIVYLRVTEHLECSSIHLDIFGREEVGKDDVEQ